MCRLFAAAIVFVAVLPSLASEPGQRPPSPLDGIITAKHAYVTKVAEIPLPIVSALYNLMKYDPRLADPGETFNATDALDGHSPRRRLIFSGGNDASWFVFYEHGGRGYMRHLVIFSVDGDKVSCRCAGIVDRRVSTFSDLESASRKGYVECNPCDPDDHF